MNTIDEIRRFRLKMLVNQYGSSKALAEIIEKGPSQLSQWINASKDSKTGKPRVVSDEIARMIEKKTGKPRGWMDSVNKPLQLGPFSLHLIADQKSESANPRIGKIPLISWDAAATRVEPFDNYHADDAEDWLPCPPNCKENSAFALRVTGDSMDDGTPQGYHDGDLIFIDGSRNVPEHNADIVIKNGDGQLTFKRLTHSDGTWYLKPLNPNWPTKIIELGSDSQIIGRVVFSGRTRG